MNLDKNSLYHEILLKSKQLELKRKRKSQKHAPKLALQALKLSAMMCAGFNEMARYKGREKVNHQIK